MAFTINWNQKEYQWVAAFLKTVWQKCNNLKTWEMVSSSELLRQRYPKGSLSLKKGSFSCVWEFVCFLKMLKCCGTCSNVRWRPSLRISSRARWKFRCCLYPDVPYFLPRMPRLQDCSFLITEQTFLYRTDPFCSRARQAAKYLEMFIYKTDSSFSFYKLLWCTTCSHKISYRCPHATDFSLLFFTEYIRTRCCGILKAQGHIMIQFAWVCH